MHVGICSSHFCVIVFSLLDRNGLEHLPNRSPNFHICRKPHTTQSQRIVCETVYFYTHSCRGLYAFPFCTFTSVNDWYSGGKCDTLCCLIPRRILTNTFTKFVSRLIVVLLTLFWSHSVGIKPFYTLILVSF